MSTTDRCPWLRRAPLGVAARFWPKVQKTDSCWVWTASKNRTGYGMMGVDGKVLLAHRISWELHHGSKPEQCVLHKCDNPSCVRPDHLFLGTLQDNTADMVAKGRVQRGERSGHARLTDQKVTSMRALNRSGVSMREVARRFDVNHATAYAAMSGRTWTHVV